MVQLYGSSDTATAWKISRFILLKRSVFHMVDNLSIVVHALPLLMFTSLSVDEILPSRYMNWSTNLRGLSFNKEWHCVTKTCLTSSLIANK